MNGYITIQINGKPVGLKFAYPAIRWFAEAAKDNIDIYFIGDDFSVEGFAKLIQCSYKNNCLIKETKPDVSYETFIDYVEGQKGSEEGQKILVDILQCYTDSSIMKDQKKRTEMNGETLITMPLSP